MRTTNKKQNYSLMSGVVYRMTMEDRNIQKYKPITLLRKVVGYSLIGYGLATFILPSGSQLALICGCGLLSIPFGLILSKIKHYGRKGLFVLGVLCSKDRLVYEYRRVML